MALELFRHSGFEVFEVGRSMFDAPALVFAAALDHNWPNFSIHDHRGIPLGGTQSVRSNTNQRVKSRIEIRDREDVLRFMLDVTGQRRGTLIEISGQVNGLLTSSSSSMTHLNLEANREGYGTLSGQPRLGVASPELTLVDHENRQVAVLRTMAGFGRGRTSESFVMSIKPGLGGPLRQLLLVLPTAVTVLRVMQQEGMAKVAFPSAWM